MRAEHGVSLVAWLVLALCCPLEPTHSHLVNQPVTVSMGSGVHPNSLGRRRAADQACPCRAPGMSDVGAGQAGERSRSRPPTGCKPWGVEKGDGGGSPLGRESSGGAEYDPDAPEEGEELARLFARHLALRGANTEGGGEKGEGQAGGGLARERAGPDGISPAPDTGAGGGGAQVGAEGGGGLGRGAGVEAAPQQEIVRKAPLASTGEAAQGAKATRRASRAEALPPTPAERFRAQADAGGQARVVRLHSEVLQFVREAQPHPHELDRRFQAVARLRVLMAACIPGSDLELFGSLATGLPLPDSDVDLVAVSMPPAPGRNATSGRGGRAKKGIPELRRVAAALRSCDWVSDVKSIDTASVPVVKFKLNLRHSTWGPEVNRSECDREALRVSDDAGLVAVDISFFHTPRNSTEYVKRHLQELRPLKPLVLVLKRLLRVHDLNDAYTGGLASHSIIMLLIFYLQNLGVGKDQKPAYAGVSPSAELGELLVNFLQFASELKPSTWGLSLRPDQPFIKLDEASNFFLENPLLEGVNVARASFRMWQVQSAFRRARHLLLSEGTPLSVLLQTAEWKREEASGAPLSRSGVFRDLHYASLASRSKSCDEGGLALRLPVSSSPSHSDDADEASNGRHEHHRELRQKPSLLSPSASEDTEDAHVHHAPPQQHRARRHSYGAFADSEELNRQARKRSSSLAHYDEKVSPNPALSGRTRTPQADAQAHPQQQQQQQWPRAQNAGGQKGQATHSKRPSQRQRMGASRAPRAQSEPLVGAHLFNGPHRSLHHRKRTVKARAEVREAGGGWTADVRESRGAGGNGGAGREGGEGSGAPLWSDIVKRTLPAQPPEDPSPE